MYGITLKYNKLGEAGWFSSRQRAQCCTKAAATAAWSEGVKKVDSRRGRRTGGKERPGPDSRGKGGRSWCNKMSPLKGHYTQVSPGHKLADTPPTSPPQHLPLRLLLTPFSWKPHFLQTVPSTPHWLLCGPIPSRYSKSLRLSLAAPLIGPLISIYTCLHLQVNWIRAYNEAGWRISKSSPARHIEA